MTWSEKRQPWIGVQLLLYFVAIGFSAQGGNSPVYAPTAFIYVKSALLLLPVLWVLGLALHRPYQALGAVQGLLRQNGWLLAYFAVCLAMLPFAVHWQYSLTRLFYSFAGFVGLYALMVQYALYNTSFETVQRHVVTLACAVPALPLASMVLSGFDLSVPGFRNNLQILNLVHPNLFASFCAQLLIVLLCRRNILSVLYVLLVYLLFSRSVFVSLVLVSGGMLVYLYRRTGHMLLLATMVAMLLGALVLGLQVMTGQVVAYDMLGLVARTNDIESIFTLTNRSVLWWHLLSGLKPLTALTGYGYSVIDPNFGIDFGTGVLFGAHNGYLSVLLGSGVFALLAMLGYFVSRFKAIRNLSQPLPVRTMLYAGWGLFLVNCLSSEEIGVSFSITLALLVLQTTMAQRSNHA